MTPSGDLETYRRKRDPKVTPEPMGSRKRSGKAPIFVIQRHDARRLHYDFRLERDGVLASWAVPKGVPLEPGRQHLAVHVEDHPLEYGSFEGEIPKGEYGAGTVEIWDRGTYELLEEKKNGGLTVRLHGERLAGVWTLIPAKLSGDPKNWLILRKREDGAVAEHREYRPMLATPAKDVPRGDGWLFEIKWDGYRIVSRVAGGEAELRSRRWEDYTQRFPGVARALPSALRSPDFVVDGEVCALDEQGRPSFSAMQQGKPETPIVYFVYDLLELDGEPLIDLPLSERLDRLEELLDRGNRNVRLSETFDDGDALAEVVRERQLEGIMAKRADSRYRPGARSKEWLKIKPGRQRQEFVVAGYTKGQGRRANSFGALVLAVHEGGELRYVGNVGTGFSEDEIAKLLGQLRPLERPDPPFREVPKMPRVRKPDVHWVEPQLVAEVEFVEWTHDGHLRAPAYQGLREDKSAEEVVSEQPLPDVLGSGKRTLKLSNLDKVFFPEDGITKGDLLTYYRAVAPAVIPHLRDRPFTLKRYPNGIHEPFFFQKDAPKGMPEWIARVPVRGDHAGEAAYDAHDPGAARQRRALAALDGEHGLHRPQRVVLAHRQARAAGLRALRPRPVAGRRLPRGRPGRAARPRRARRARARRLPEDERLGRDARARARGAPAHVRRDARVLRDRRAGARAHAPRARHDRVGQGEAPRRAPRLEPERRGEDDRVRLLGAAARRRARLDAARVGRGRTRASIPRRSPWRSCSAGSSSTAISSSRVLTTRQRLDRALKALR